VFDDLKDAYQGIKSENADSRVNRRIKLRAKAKDLFATAISADATAENLNESEVTDIDQMVTAIMKAEPANTWPGSNTTGRPQVLRPGQPLSTITTSSRSRNWSHTYLSRRSTRTGKAWYCTDLMD